MNDTQRSENVFTKQRRIAHLACQRPQERLTALNHYQGFVLHTAEANRTGLGARKKIRQNHGLSWFCPKSAGYDFHAQMKNPSPTAQILPFQPTLCPALPLVLGNVDYREFARQLRRIDQLLCASGVEENFVGQSLAHFGALALEFGNKPPTSENLRAERERWTRREKLWKLGC